MPVLSGFVVGFGAAITAMLLSVLFAAGTLSAVSLIPFMSIQSAFYGLK